MSLSTMNDNREREPVSLADGVRQIYSSTKFWDIEFKVDGQSFKGHRLILGARSPKLAKMLLKPDPPREIRDESSKTGFEILFRFIYTDELGTTNQNEIFEGYRVAINFEQKELIEKCEELIGNMDITKDNVFTILNQASDIDILRERCLNFIAFNSTAVLESEDLLNASLSTVQEIFKQDCLNDVPALVLQRNILRWGCNLFPDIRDYSLVRDQLLGLRILGKLKIQELSVEALAAFTLKYPDLITLAEYQKLNFHALKINQSLPDWCEQ